MASCDRIRAREGVALRRRWRPSCRPSWRSCSWRARSCSYGRIGGHTARGGVASAVASSRSVAEPRRLPVPMIGYHAHALRRLPRWSAVTRLMRRDGCERLPSRARPGPCKKCANSTKRGCGPLGPLRTLISYTLRSRQPPTAVAGGPSEPTAARPCLARQVESYRKKGCVSGHRANFLAPQTTTGCHTPPCALTYSPKAKRSKR